MAEKHSPSRLGRGLSALLGDAPLLDAPGDRLLIVPLDQIRPNPAQPRRRVDDDALAVLAESIVTTGLVQPVVVRPLPEGGYELIAGERRWRAARIAGLPGIPAVLREADERERLEMGLVENLVRQDLDPIETAQALAALIEDFGQTQTEVARRVGRSRSSVANLIRLLELPDDVQALLVAGTLTEGHGRAILMADGARRRREVARRAAAKGLSVRATEDLARANTDGGRPRREREAPDISDAAIDAFHGAFEAPVRVRSAARGRVIVEIAFPDEAAVRVAMDRLGPG